MVGRAGPGALSRCRRLHGGAGRRRFSRHRVPEQVWLLEHPPALHRRHERAGRRSARFRSVSRSSSSGRGGQYTYHGPGQRVAYVMLDLAGRRRMDLRSFVRDLEQWLIGTLGGVRRGRTCAAKAESASGSRRTAARPRLRRSGCACAAGSRSTASSLNVSPGSGPLPGASSACGIREHGVTSLAALSGSRPRWRMLTARLQAQFRRGVRLVRAAGEVQPDDADDDEDDGTDPERPHRLLEPDVADQGD